MLRSDPRNTCRFELTDAAFQRDADQLLRLDGELHGELLHDLAAEAVHHQGDGVLLRQAALAAVEQLVLADARGGRLVLDDRLRSEEHTSLQSLMRISYAVFCLKKKNKNTNQSKQRMHHQNN